uniref:Threonyl/alanyl tRNA synthetase SAD domain-containing protein n=1 Tax=Kalanchoe fedtschenkoi TaxID=63787 RepID=A0A7N0UMZ6_KALFE
MGSHILQEGDGRQALILDSTIFHPQGGGQPSDTGLISSADDSFKFVVEDVRSKGGIVFHYGCFETGEEEFGSGKLDGKEVFLFVDKARRNLNSRLHSAGHLIDVCLEGVGLGHLKPGKAYHFPDGPYVEYQGTVQQDKWQTKQQELEIEANALISKGGKITAATLSYEEALQLCGGSLPDYISKSSNPRIVTLGNYPGCPCGGTHVPDISDINSLKVTQLRSKKGMTKVFYNVDS